MKTLDLNQGLDFHWISLSATTFWAQKVPVKRCDSDYKLPAFPVLKGPGNGSCNHRSDRSWWEREQGCDTWVRHCGLVLLRQPQNGGSVEPKLQYKGTTPRQDNLGGKQQCHCLSSLAGKSQSYSLMLVGTCWLPPPSLGEKSLCPLLLVEGE